MTDPQNAPAMPPPPAPAAPAPAAPAPARSPMSGMLASMSQAEMLMAGGAVLILLTDLVFVIFGDYSFSTVAWGAAAVALILILANGRASAINFSRSTYQALLIVLGMLALVVGVRELIRDLVFIPGRNLSVSFLLGMVGLYVGVALMGFAAWQLWRGRSA